MLLIVYLLYVQIEVTESQSEALFKQLDEDSSKGSVMCSLGVAGPFYQPLLGKSGGKYISFHVNNKQKGGGAHLH